MLTIFKNLVDVYLVLYKISWILSEDLLLINQGKMEYVRKYIELYPQDKVVIKGGAAADLFFQEYLMERPVVKDIDVSINTSERRQTIVQRWLAIIPSTYRTDFDEQHPSGIFTIVDPTGSDKSLDVFVNEDVFSTTEVIDGFHVESLGKTINNLHQELVGRKVDIEFMREQKERFQEEIGDHVNKYNRLLARLELLLKCHKERQQRRAAANK